MGVSEVIVLDLTSVGSGEGVNVDFLKKTLKEDMEVYVGGGVRDINDLIRLKDLGVLVCWWLLFCIRAKFPLMN